MLDKDDYEMINDALDVLEGSAKTSRMLVGMLKAGIADSQEEAKKSLSGISDVSDEERVKEAVLKENIVLLRAKLIKIRNEDLVKAATALSSSEGGS